MSLSRFTWELFCKVCHVITWKKIGKYFLKNFLVKRICLGRYKGGPLS
jgi:hypothetical protein